MKPLRLALPLLLLAGCRPDGPPPNRSAAAHAIIIGAGIAVTNDYELAIGGWDGTPVRRVCMTPAEYAVLADLLQRAAKEP